MSQEEYDLPLIISIDLAIVDVVISFCPISYWICAGEGGIKRQLLGSGLFMDCCNVLFYIISSIGFIEWGTSNWEGGLALCPVGYGCIDNRWS